MKSPLRTAIHGAFASIALGLASLPSTAFAQQGWAGYGPAQVASPPTVYYTNPAPGYSWQGYTPGSAWGGPAYAPSGPVVATVPARPVTVPGAGWSGYNPAASWTGYAPASAWSGYTPGYISAVPRSELPRYDRRLAGWGWTGNGNYREPGTGRPTPMLRPWLPGAAGS
ncbi:hypothetical protein [Tautonia plasticadhaerens]|uniref:YXWGXW repeat (2 copies) n=1 Tax=Tautonia plasticadhaerens TaxID=2527974 RepID=A0A518HDV1_9BACT|nr:hypothetical protein [Tautonia plasticadhaerens]QDV39032.1 hypothetical protein ElP_69930 [Tautonia plasticadhaerens]